MSEEPGWYPDPYFLGRERRWDGRAWTEECRSAETKETQPSAKPRPAKNPDAATPSATAAKVAAKSAAGAGALAAAPAANADAPPREAAATAATAATASVAASAATGAGVTEESPAAAAEVPVVSADPPTQQVERPAAAAPSTERVQAELSATDAGADEGARADSDSDTDTDESARADTEADGKDHRKPPTRRRRRLLVGGAAAIVIVIAVAVVAALTKGATAPGGGPEVAQAALATAGQQYAAVNVDVKVQSGDKAAASTVSGFSSNGTMDFASSLGSLTLSGPGSAASEQLVLDNQTLYLDPAGLVGQLVKNKVWISATPDDLGASLPPLGFAVAPTLFEELVGNPATLLRQLEERGVTATALHDSIYQGTPVQEYNVTLTQQAINVRLQGLPSSLRSAIATGHGPEHVFVTTNGLVRAISVPISVENNGAQASGHVVVSFSSWGDVVDIAAPPADQVVSWAQLKAVLNFASKLG